MSVDTLDRYNVFWNSPSADYKGMPKAEASPFKVAYEQIAPHLGGGPLPDCINENFIAVHETGAFVKQCLFTCNLRNSERNQSP